MQGRKAVEVAELHAGDLDLEPALPGRREEVVQRRKVLQVEERKRRRQSAAGEDDAGAQAALRGVDRALLRFHRIQIVGPGGNEHVASGQ